MPAPWADAAQQWLAANAAPALGVLLALYLDGSALPEFVKIHRTGELGDMNPLPYATMLVTGLAWVVYSTVIVDGWVFAASLPGLVLSVWYTYTACGCCRTRLAMSLGLSIAAGAYACLGMAGAALGLGHGALESLWGWAANATLVLFYASPLSTVGEVLTKWDSSSLYWPLAVAEAIYGALWLVYGLAVRDPHIWAPNAFGAAFGAAQVALALAVPAGGGKGGPAGGGGDGGAGGAGAAAEAAGDDAERPLLEGERP